MQKIYNSILHLVDMQTGSMKKEFNEGGRIYTV